MYLSSFLGGRGERSGVLGKIMTISLEIFTVQYYTMTRPLYTRPLWPAPTYTRSLHSAPIYSLAPHNKSGRWSPNSSCQLSPAKKPVGKIRQLSHFWHSSPTPPRPLSAPVAFFGPKITELGCFSDLTQDNRGLSVAPPSVKYSTIRTL